MHCVSTPRRCGPFKVKDKLLSQVGMCPQLKRQVSQMLLWKIVERASYVAFLRF